MNVAENYMLRQMQQMAANMSGVPKTGGSGSKKDQTDSFQDMLDQTGKDTAVNDKENPSVGSQDGQDQKEPVQDAKGDAAEKPAGKPEKEPGKAQELHGDPNAMASVMDLFRPEIVDVSEAETTAAAAPVETVVQESAAVETAVEETVPEIKMAVTQVAEEKAPVQEAPQETQAATEELPETEKAQPVAEAPKAESVEAAPEKSEAVKEVKPEAVEVREAGTEEAEKPQEDAAEIAQPVFQKVDTAPMKVGESYKTVDTEEPHMEEKLADTVREAVQAGAERGEIQLSPANLGRITIEMTRSVEGMLEVVIHAATTKAAGLLSQHLDGLHAALQNYSQETVQVEVQRSQESQEQHLFQHADPDGRGNQQRREEQHQQQQEEEHSSGDFLQKLRLGLVSLETI